MKKSLRRASVLAAAVLALAPLTIGPASAITSTTTPSTSLTPNMNGTWAGTQYASTPAITSATMTFRLPTAINTWDASSNDAIWVGLSATSGYPFTQNGLTIQKTGVSPGWFEVFDKYGNTKIYNVASDNIFKFGDTITESIAYDPNSTTFTFTWKDITQNFTVTSSLANAAAYYGGSRADYIVESAPVQDDLANFGNLAITATAAHGASALPGVVATGNQWNLISQDQKRYLAVSTAKSTSTFAVQWYNFG